VPSAQPRLLTLLVFVAGALSACNGSIGVPNAPMVVTTGPYGPYIPGGPNDPADPTDPVLPDVPKVCQPAFRAPAPLRRLTRDEYANSVRDLFGGVANTQALGSDEKVGAFLTNIAAPISRLGVEQYATVAETLASTAVGDLSVLLPCDPVQAGELDCAKQFISGFVRRAYRRPLTQVEADRYEALYTAEKNRADFTQGIRLVVQTALQSPNFLYHIERVPADDATAVVTAYELASRLAYFLWNSPPDDALLDAAADGSLATSTGLNAQVDRMLASSKAKAMIGNFHLQMLGVEKDRKPDKVSTTFPQFDDAMWKAMLDETVNFSDHVVLRGDGKLSTLFSTDYTVLDGPLFALYGITKPTNNDPAQPVSTVGTKRSGLLTLGSFLSTMAHTETTSPVLRGRTVIRNLLCQTLPNPPDTVDAQIPPPQPGQTMREVITTITTVPNSSCVTCHERINPLGFALENFDAIGALRTHDNGKLVDTAGALKGLSPVEGSFSDGIELSKQLGQSAEVDKCFTRQWFRFAVGRGENANESCELYNLGLEFRNHGSNVKWLLRTLATSAAFQRPPEKI
jgi:hypothetical protein